VHFLRARKIIQSSLLDQLQILTFHPAITTNDIGVPFSLLFQRKHRYLGLVIHNGHHKHSDYRSIDQIHTFRSPSLLYEPYEHNLQIPLLCTITHY